MLRDRLYRIFRRFDLDRYEAVRRMIPLREGSWLDAGCGAGKLFDACPTFSGWCVGADLNFGLLSEASGKNLQNCSYLQFDLDSPLPFRDASFELVTCVSALQYAECAGKLFLEICRILRPGGYFVFEVPNFEVFYRKLDEWKAKCTGQPSQPESFWRGVKTRFTKRLIDELIGDYGEFRLLALRTAGIFAGLRNTWPSLLGSEFACLLQKVDGTR